MVKSLYFLMISFSFSLLGMKKTDEELLHLASTTKGKRLTAIASPFPKSFYVFRYNEDEVSFNKLGNVEKINQLLALPSMQPYDTANFVNQCWVLTKNFFIKKSKKRQELAQMGAILLGTKDHDVMVQLILSHIKQSVQKDNHG